MESEIQRIVGCGLAAVSSIYESRADGVLIFRGERPSDEWDGHGYFKRWLWTLVDGKRVRRPLLKARWRHKRRSQLTCHSRPPDDVAQIHFCTVVVVVCLWAWLVSGKGAEVYDAQARKLLSYIIANGTVVILPHAKDAAGDDGKADVDIWNVLKAGQIHEPGEWDGKFEQWRYRFHTARFAVAVAFEQTSSCVVVTFWQKRGGA